MTTDGNQRGSPSGRNATGRLILGVVVGGLVAGTVDIFAAAAINAAPPGVILKAIASGLLGHGAFKGGVGTMVLGLVLQWAMSLVIAAIYGAARR